jgi:hypothetical protein
MRRLRSYGTLRGAGWQLNTDVSEQPVGPTVNRSSSPGTGLSDRLAVPKRRYRLTSQNNERHLPPTERQAHAKHYRTERVLIFGLIFFLVFVASDKLVGP